jgi:hypothetical protein
MAPAFADFQPHPNARRGGGGFVRSTWFVAAIGVPPLSAAMLRSLPITGGGARGGPQARTGLAEKGVLVAKAG